jgi:hypothetical protein
MALPRLQPVTNSRAWDAEQPGDTRGVHVLEFRQSGNHVPFYVRTHRMRRVGLEPTSPKATRFERAAFADFATAA